MSAAHESARDVPEDGVAEGREDCRPRPPASVAARPEILASATGAWPGDDPREAASAAFSALGAGYPPVPLTGVPVEVADAGASRGGHDGGSGHGLAGPGDRPGRAWRIDTVGLALSLSDGLHADLTSYGWRLTLSSAGSRDRDVSRIRSASARGLEACEEYGQGFSGRTLLSLPGPWALLRRLSLPDGNPALADPGARRDVVQAYALGTAELLARMSRALGAPPRVRLVEPDLDAILTGTLPTVSGYRNLPAVPDAQVTGALRSFVRRTGDDTILALPGLATVTIAGKPIAHRALAAEAGVTAVAVDLPGAASPSASLRAWEEIAQAHESGTQVWLHLPASAGSSPDRVKAWLGAVSDPWHRVGMNASALTEIGILAGAEPLAARRHAVPDAPVYGAAQYRLAANLAQALREENE